MIFLSPIQGRTGTADYALFAPKQGRDGLATIYKQGRDACYVIDIGDNVEGLYAIDNFVDRET